MFKNSLYKKKNDHELSKSMRKGLIFWANFGLFCTFPTNKEVSGKESEQRKRFLWLP